MNAIKMKILQKIAGLTPINYLSESKCRIGDWTIHVRECRKSKDDGKSYAFSVYETALAADYEVWICGCSDYYLIPMPRIRKIIPFAYKDRKNRCPVLSVDVMTHRCQYSRYRNAEDLSVHFKDTLNGKPGPRIEVLEW